MTVQGIPDFRQALSELPKKLRARALREALRAAAVPVRRLVRAHTPVLSPASPAAMRGRRVPGLLRRAVSIRTSKLASRRGDAAVFVNVRPGRKGKEDPFYWRWLQRGFRRGKRLVPGLKFLDKGAGALPEALSIFTSKIGPIIQRLNRPQAPTP